MDYPAIRELLQQKRKIVITTHRNPDGDALGSSLGLYHFLQGLGHDVQVITPNNYPKFLQWMPGEPGVMKYEGNEEQASAQTQDADIIFSLDYNALYRMEEFGKVVGQSKGVKIMIDHHREPDGFADHMLSDTGASSTAQLIYDFIEGLEGTDRINQDIAECLYAGIMTDTGSFRFSGTSARTHRIAAALIEAGLKPHKVHQAISDTNSLDRLQLKGYALSEKLVHLPQYHTAYISLSLKELHRFRFRKGDTEGLVNYALSIEGVQFAALFTEDEHYVKVSLRSKDDFDVNQLSRTHFNGGGHLNAAGGRSDRSLQDTCAYLESILPDYEKALEASA